MSPDGTMRARGVERRFLCSCHMRTTESSPTPVWLEQQSRAQATTSSRRTGKTKQTIRPYGMAYLRAELRRLNRERKAAENFYMPSPPHKDRDRLRAALFSPEYHLKELERPFARGRKAARQRAMASFHRWFEKFTATIMHQVGDMDWRLRRLMQQPWIGLECQVRGRIRNMVENFKTYFDKQSSLPLNPKYLFFKYISCGLPELTTQLEDLLQENVYGDQALLHTHKKSERTKDLKELYRIANCLEEIIFTTDTTSYYSYRNVVDLVAIHKMMLSLQYHVDETVRVMENSEAIFDILAEEEEDMSWGVNISSNLPDSLLFLVHIRQQGIPEDLKFNPPTLDDIFQARYVPKKKPVDVPFPKENQNSAPSADTDTDKSQTEGPTSSLPCVILEESIKSC